MLSRPGAFAGDPHIPDLLEAQAFSPDRDGHPEHALLALEPVARHPGRLLGELNAVEQYHGVAERSFGEEARIGREIRLGSGHNHFDILH